MWLQIKERTPNCYLNATVFFLIILMPTYVVLLIHSDTISLPIQDNTQDVWRF